MHRVILSILLVSILLLSGCAFWKGFKAGITGEELNPDVITTTVDTGAVAGETLKKSIPYFPSPWREILVACVAAVTGWGAASTKEEKSKA